jgi:predicted outer membrane protein
MKPVSRMTIRWPISSTTTAGVGIALALVACSRTPPSSPNGLAPLDDGQIAEIVDVIDTQQIQTAQLGVDHGSDAETRAFAEDLLRDQRAERKEWLVRLAGERVSLQPSILIELFESRERAARAWLSNESGPAFDRDFLANEIKEQTRQLDWLDHMFMPGVHDADLRAELQRRRAITASRLASAQRLSLRLVPASPPPQL